MRYLYIFKICVLWIQLTKDIVLVYNKNLKWKKWGYEIRSTCQPKTPNIALHVMPCYISPSKSSTSNFLLTSHQMLMAPGEGGGTCARTCQLSAAPRIRGAARHCTISHFYRHPTSLTSWWMLCERHFCIMTTWHSVKKQIKCFF